VISDGRGMAAWANPARRHVGVGGGDECCCSTVQAEGGRGPETERSPAVAAVVSPVSASRCEAARAARRRSVRACSERWLERRRRRGAEGTTASGWADAGA
jgi:hypothetical protein